MGARTGTFPNELTETTVLENDDTILIARGNNILTASASVLATGGNSVVVDDNLTSTSTINALSANQGKVLKDIIDTLSAADVGAEPTGSLSTHIAAADPHGDRNHSVQRANHTGTQLAATISDFNTSAGSAAPVQSVFGRTGTVVAGIGDYTVTQVTGAQSTANLSTDTSLSGGAGTYPNSPSVKTYVDNQTAGLLQLRGGWDASSNLFPTTGGSGPGDAVFVGDTWYVTVAGTLGSKAVVVGDGFFANVNTPAQTSANWTQFDANAGFTSENVANKATAFGMINNTLYPTVKAVDDNYVSVNAQTLTSPQKVQVKANIGLDNTDGLSEGSINKYFTDARAVASVLTGYVVAVTNAVVAATDTVSVALGKLQKQITDLAGNFRYVITQANLVANAYTVQSTDVSPYGNKILKVVNTVPTTITLSTPSSLTASIGDSFNIRQGGIGGITITGDITGVSTTSVQHTTITLIAESPTSWMSVGG